MNAVRDTYWYSSKQPVVIAIAALIQAALLMAYTNISGLFLTSMLFVGWLFYQQIQHGSHAVYARMLLMIAAIGGLGMILGALLDATDLAGDYCVVDASATLNVLSYQPHGLSQLGSYTTLLMLLFCLPCCLFYQTTEQRPRFFWPVCARHISATIAMLTGMLLLPMLVVEQLAPLISKWFELRLVLSFFHHHLLMLIGMLAGAWLGYFLYDFWEHRLSLVNRRCAHHDGR